MRFFIPWHINVEDIALVIDVDLALLQLNSGMEAVLGQNKRRGNSIGFPCLSFQQKSVECLNLIRAAGARTPEMRRDSGKAVSDLGTFKES